MADPINPTSASWFATARENLRDAESLARSHSWRNAYGLAGASAECALKGKIMQRLRVNRWPERQEQRDLYTHDLGVLADIAGLQASLEEVLREGNVIGNAWMVTKDFSITLRYPSEGSFPIKLGRDMVQALGRDGLLEWLIAQTV